MKKQLNVGIDLPMETVTQRIGIIGQTGMGKTHLTTVLTEELIETNVPVVCLDPQGVMYGLRSSRDGKSAGYPIVILGGDHQDVPLEPTAGKVIADWVCSDRQSCVLDLSSFRKGEQRTFATDFAETLFRRNREPIHLVVDEADLFAPQRALPDQKRMLGAFEDLCRRGRSRGIGMTLATQRPAVLNKDLLTQVALLVSLRLTGPQDRHALEDWIRYNADEDQKQQVLSTLATLPVGTAWFWSPGWLGMLKKAKVRQRHTYDSSATPKLGTRASDPKRAPVDLQALSTRIADTIERAKKDDPSALRRRISELETEVSRLEQATDPELSMYKQLFEKISDLIARHSPKKDRPLPLDLKPPQLVGSWPGSEQGKPPPVGYGRDAPNHPDVVVGGGLRRILTALAQRRDGLTKKQIGVRAQLSSKSGTFGTYLSRARSQGWIETSGDRLVITETGLFALGSYAPLPTGADLRAHWCSELKGGAARMLETLCEAYPAAITAEQLGHRAGISPNSGTFGTYLSKLRTLELVTGPRECLAASEDLF